MIELGKRTFRDIVAGENNDAFPTVLSSGTT